MKNATKPPKRKLLGFAEQLGSTPVPVGPSGVGLTKSPIPAGTRQAAAKANKTKVASVSSEAPVAPAVVPAEPATALMVAPAPAIAAVSKPASPPPVKVPPPVQVAKSKTGAGGPNKFILITLVVVAIVVAGPSLALLAGTFAYPLIVLAGIVGVWKLYDSSRSKGK
jgi:hypothetical protein